MLPASPIILSPPPCRTKAKAPAVSPSGMSKQFVQKLEASTVDTGRHDYGTSVYEKVSMSMKVEMALREVPRDMPFCRENSTAKGHGR